MPRFFIDDRPQGELYTLTGENAHHAGRVLRLRPGETLTLCDGAGTDFDCTVEQAEKDEVVCRVQAVHPSETEPRQDMTLFMALPKGDKMEFRHSKIGGAGRAEDRTVLSKTVCPARTRPIKRSSAGGRSQQRPQSSADEAICRVVTAVESAEKAFAMASDSGTALFFYEHETRGLRETLEGQGVSDTVSLVVGPEGGFAPEEVQAAQNAGLSSVSLGTRILRCETAPVAALAAVLYAGGNM